MEENVACPNSMVDRITPATTDEQRDFVLSNYGYKDASPVFCEPFRQWVLEDKFPAGRPNFDTLENVKFVPDVMPYEFMKIRILNGGHASLCYPAALLGLKHVHDAMEHPTIGPFLDALERNEIIPTVPAVPDTDLEGYWKIIANRFSNPTLNDTIGRICFDGASRQPKFVIPVAKDNLQSGRSFDGLALVSAMWCRYCQGTTEAGETIAPNDPQWDRLNTIALEAKQNPKAWLDMRDVYGEAVGKSPAFLQSFTKALNKIQTDGAEAAMKEYIAKSQN
jgi:mannitol 2-dehydrogenase